MTAGMTHPAPPTPLNVLVTGAGGGIGSAAVKALRQAGHTAHAWDIPEHDVTDPAGVDAALSTLEETHGPLDALIHCAGTLIADSALHPDPAAIEQSVRINLSGTVTTCSAVARRMVDRGEGAIVAISSNAAAVPRAGMASYGLSKAAATSWLRTLALECAPYGVRCNIVSPGSTDTPMLRGMWPADSAQSAEVHLGGVIAGSAENFRLGIPLGRVADPADIAAACLFLISPAAKHITMHDLRVDGGATLDS